MKQKWIYVVCGLFFLTMFVNCSDDSTSLPTSDMGSSAVDTGEDVAALESGIDQSTLPDMFTGDGNPPWIPGGEGPWDDPLCYSTSTDGMTFVKQGLFLDHAGVANLIMTSQGQLIATYQYFSYKYEHMFDKIAYSVRDEQNQTWDGPHLVTITGLPATGGGGTNPVDPTLVELSDGSLRLYFTYHPPGAPNPYTTSAKAEGIDKTFVHETGIRVSNDEAILLDCAVVFYNGLWHYFAPNHDSTPNNAIHATSENGLDFTRQDDITLPMDFLGNPLATDTGIRFYGTGNGVASAFSTDGFQWQMENGSRGEGADPAVAKLTDGTYLMIHAGGCKN